VQSNPQDSNAWLLLGSTQAENEKEVEAIIALEHAVQLNPENTRALMDLAVSYTNEGQELQALATLERWIKTQYPNMVPENMRSVVTATSFPEVISLYLEAVRRGPTLSKDPVSGTVDYQVQNGLGLLFYNNHEIDKALDCFNSALSIHPDHVSWNRVGAVLSNSGRSEEAISAYYKALELKPGFVRARYNLGVACLNVGCYKESVGHLLSAITLHESGSSDHIWDALRRVFVMMERRDMVDLVETKNPSNFTEFML
jgi:peroxin-5